eukprot:1161084-Pelagomonas_calceolata.AAC.2
MAVCAAANVCPQSHLTLRPVLAGLVAKSKSGSMWGVQFILPRQWWPGSTHSTPLSPGNLRALFAQMQPNRQLESASIDRIRASEFVAVSAEQEPSRPFWLQTAQAVDF